ncbi:hypothetical protein, partial [Serratia marcescens]|uniref:hypothetical protein n=1 Tax=Serratia marcescens TaxID=615 RepID=UPI001953BCFA
DVKSSIALAMGSVPPMVYLVGDYTVEKPREETAAEITEEDVALVAEQAGVSMEEARKALLE